MTTFTDLSSVDLRTLADALRSGRLAAPFTSSLVKRTNISPASVDTVVAGLQELESQGFNEKQISILLSAVEYEKKASRKIDELVSLVITGPEAPGTTIRDTGVVVRDLFRRATKSVVVVGYSVYQGRHVFAALAERMNEIADLDSTMYLNLPPVRDSMEESIVTRRFARDFADRHWPKGSRLPTIYYDPRSIASDRSKRASLHAKCIVVDGHEIFISSANFTQRAQNMNIEVGVRFDSTAIAKQLSNHFRSLVSVGALRKIPLDNDTVERQ